MLGESSVIKTPYTAMANYLAYGAAMLTPPNEQGVDLMIPLVLKDAETKSCGSEAAVLNVSEMENQARNKVNPTGKDAKKKVFSNGKEPDVVQDIQMDEPNTRKRKFEDVEMEFGEDNKGNQMAKNLTNDDESLGDQFKSSDLSFVYIQVKFGKSYQELPTPGEVGKVCPHLVFGDYFGIGKPNVPYCYIYHHISANEMKYRIIEHTENKSAIAPVHFPCLALFGTSTADTNLKKLMTELTMKHAPSSDPHHPLRRTWAVHENKLQIEDAGEFLDYD
jgi:hypothetical protein